MRYTPILFLLGLLHAHTTATHTTTPNLKTINEIKTLAGVKKTGMTLTIAIIMFIELFICFGICVWFNKEVHIIKKKKQD